MEEQRGGEERSLRRESKLSFSVRDLAKTPIRNDKTHSLNVPANNRGKMTRKIFPNSPS